MNEFDAAGIVESFARSQQEMREAMAEMARMLNQIAQVFGSASNRQGRIYPSGVDGWRVRVNFERGGHGQG